jgi:hypothetical protein
MAQIWNENNLSVLLLLQAEEGVVSYKAVALLTSSNPAATAVYTRMLEGDAVNEIESSS